MLPGILGLLLALFLANSVAVASHDPSRTVTLYVHGFEVTGADRHGVYGEDLDEPVADSVAALVGLPTHADSIGPVPPNLVVGTIYYGDTPPSYYTAADVADVEAITAQWGGGVPRYALILAKHARHVLQRSGASQVNFVSASFGTLAVRWLIEKNVEGLAGEGRIARWLSLEGVLAGNWVASHDELVDLLSLVQPEPIDVSHMKYDWIESHLHAPRADADDPLYANILVGQVASTDDRANGAALRNAMLTYNEYAPNDGVQALPDARFRSMAPAARFLGMPPTFAVFHADHLGLADHRAAWAQAATFLTARRRVTVTMTSARVTNLHEPQFPWWDWRPAEVLFESRVLSPAAQARWGLTEAQSSYLKEGAAAPLERYRTNGETRPFQHLLFDDFVLPEERELWLDLHTWELDYDPRYGVVETIQTPYYDDMGGGSLVVSTESSGTYTLALADWSCVISVSVFEYPFQNVLGVDAKETLNRPRRLAISPLPASSWVRISLAAEEGTPFDGLAALEIVDVSGRIVRRMQAESRRPFVWDGRDSEGKAVPSGIYLARLLAAGAVRQGRICLVR